MFWVVPVASCSSTGHPREESGSTFFPLPSLSQGHAYGQLVGHQGSQVFLCKAVFPASWPPTCTGTKGEGGLNKKGGRRENVKEKRVGGGVGESGGDAGNWSQYAGCSRLVYLSLIIMLLGEDQSLECQSTSAPMLGNLSRI